MLSSSSADSTSLAVTCIDQLSAFLSDADQNLRYIALKGLSRLLATHAHLLSVHYERILACIEEDDLTIRMKALELVERLTDRSNCKEVVGRLLLQISPSSIPSPTKIKAASEPSRPSAAASLRAIFSTYDTASPSGLASIKGASSASLSTSNSGLSAYRHRLLLLILRLTSRSSEDGSQLYVNISNFEWYIDTLVSVSYLSLSLTPSASSASPLAAPNDSAAIGANVADSLLDVTARAASIREFAIKRLTRLLADDGFVGRTNAGGSNILSAAGFILSEYGSSTSGKEICRTLLERAAQTPAASEHLLLCALKALSKWLNSLAMNRPWREESLSSIRNDLNEILGEIKNVGKAADYYAHLVSLVIAGFNGPRLHVKQTEDTAETTPTQEVDETEGESVHNPFASISASSITGQQHTSIETEKGPPTSLILLYSLLFAYELRPLAPAAQAAVAVPEDLDLDAWVGQPLDDASLVDTEDEKEQNVQSRGEVDEYGRLKAVSVHLRTHSRPFNNGPTDRKGKKSKRKAHKVASSQEAEDVDSIPIVKLDLDDEDLLIPAPSTNGSSVPESVGKSRNSAAMAIPVRSRTPSPPPLILSAGGDMPLSRPSRAVPASSLDSNTDSPDLLDLQSNGQAYYEGVGPQPTVTVVKVKKMKKKQKDEEGGETLKRKKDGRAAPLEA